MPSNRVARNMAKYPEDRKSFSSLLETSTSSEESSKRSSLSAFQCLFDMDIWSTQAKGPFGKTTPQGIKEIRDLLADETLSIEERIIKARVIGLRRLTKPITNRSLVVHQCYVEFNKRIFEKFFSEAYSNVGTNEHEKIGNIISSQGEKLIAVITGMQREIEETALSLKNTIQKIPVDGIKALLSKMSGFLQEQETETTSEISKLNVLLCYASSKTRVNSEDHLEVLKCFISAYIFLKNKIELTSKKSIKNKEDLFCQDLFATLDLVAEGFRNSGYQALLDKIHCDRHLSGKKLFSALRNAENDKVMASQYIVSIQTPYMHSSELEFAITAALAKLEAIVPFHQQWLGPDLVSTSLGKILSSLREQVEQISKLSYFTPTGIKNLDNAFKVFDNRPLQQGEEKEVIALLEKIHKLTTERLQGYSRHPLLHLFYSNTAVLFAELVKPQTAVTNVASYEEIQAKARHLWANDSKFIADNGDFNYFNGVAIDDSFPNMLKQFKKEVNDFKWNEKGMGFFYLYRKLPDGIARLQKMFQANTFDFSQNKIMGLPSAQKIDFIKLVLQVHALLKQKALSPNSSRDKEVTAFYEAHYCAFRNRLKELKDTNKELYSIFCAIDYADVLPSTEAILSYLRVPGRIDNTFAAIKPERNLFPVGAERSQLSGSSRSTVVPIAPAELSAESADAPSISVSLQR